MLVFAEAVVVGTEPDVPDVVEEEEEVVEDEDEVKEKQEGDVDDDTDDEVQFLLHFVIYGCYLLT